MIIEFFYLHLLYGSYKYEIPNYINKEEFLEQYLIPTDNYDKKYNKNSTLYNVINSLQWPNFNDEFFYFCDKSISNCFEITIKPL